MWISPVTQLTSRSCWLGTASEPCCGPRLRVASCAGGICRYWLPEAARALAYAEPVTANILPVEADNARLRVLQIGKLRQPVELRSVEGHRCESIVLLTWRGETSRYACAEETWDRVRWDTVFSRYVLSPSSSRVRRPCRARPRESRRSGVWIAGPGAPRTRDHLTFAEGLYQWSSRRFPMRTHASRRPATSMGSRRTSACLPSRSSSDPIATDTQMDPDAPEADVLRRILGENPTRTAVLRSHHTPCQGRHR